MTTESVPCNWNNLPNELKLKCVEEMDFKTRIGLRSTAKREKILVDLKKYQFKHGLIAISQYMSTFDVAVNNSNKEEDLRVKFSNSGRPIDEKNLSDFPDRFDKCLQFLKQVLLLAEFKSFKIRALYDGKDDKDIKKVVEMIESLPKLAIDKLIFTLNDKKYLESAMLKKCDQLKLKEVKICQLKSADTQGNADFFHQLLLNTDTLRIEGDNGSSEERGNRSFTALCAMLIGWVNGWWDPRVGQTMYIETCGNFNEELVRQFTGFGVFVNQHPTENACRIRHTANSKHICIRRNERTFLLEATVVDPNAGYPDYEESDKKNVPPPSPLEELMRFMTLSAEEKLEENRRASEHPDYNDADMCYEQEFWD